jgi:hypothetical protein
LEGVLAAAAAAAAADAAAAAVAAAAVAARDIGTAVTTKVVPHFGQTIGSLLRS